MLKFKTKPDYIKQYKDKEYKDLDKVSTYRIIKSLSDSKKSILDIGCGTGYLLEYLGGGTGVDLDPKLIEECKKNHPSSKFITSDCYNIPLPNDHFDLITMCMVLEHLTNPIEALTEAKRMLKIGGNLIIVVPNKNDWFYNFLVKKDPTHVREYSPIELRELTSGLFITEGCYFGTVSTKIPAFLTNYIKSDIILNCKKTN